MDNQGQKEFKTGKGYLYEKNARPLPKFMKGIMVAGGLSYKGVSKLIFVTGTMTSISYLQSLKYYKEDIEVLGAGALRNAVVDGDVVTGSVMAGQIAGLIRKEETCEEILKDIYYGAQEVILAEAKRWADIEKD